MNGTAMQFVRVISRVEDMEIWNANRNGFSFVIGYESRSGPGLHGRTCFVAAADPSEQVRREGYRLALLKRSVRPKKPVTPC